MSDPILELRDIRARYGPIEVLKGVSIKIFPGEICTIIGSNGAGKTTTLMCASGVKSISGGQVLFDSRDISDMPAHRRVALGLAQVPEGRKIFPRMTILENLQLGAYLQRDKTAVSRDLAKVYELFPILRERAAQAAGTLSGGEQQMLAIGRALMSRPRVLLMDEPSMGVAPLIVKRIFETISELNRSGMTILLVEQNAHLALGIARRGYVLETGLVTLEDSAESLLADARVREAYLGD